MKHSTFQLDNARRLRKEMTPSECKLWRILRGRRIGGLKFRRQEPIDRYFADFVCYEARLIVELDGDSHLGREEYDRERENYLKSQGFCVIRFENFETKLTENAVVERILTACREHGILFPLTPNPSPAEGEGRKT